MKKRLKRLISLATLLALCWVLLPGCSSQSIVHLGLEPTVLSGSEVIPGAEPPLIYSTDYSVSESGLFAMTGRMMRYYDFSTGKSYAVCPRPNCRHVGPDCPANFTAGSAIGLAQVGEYLYVVKRNETEQTYELLELDLKGEQQRVVFSMDAGKQEPDSWHIEEVLSVDYTPEMAWLTVCYDYTNKEGGSGYVTGEGAQIVGVRLADGEAVYLNDIPEDDNIMYAIETLSSDYVVVEKSWYDPAHPDQETFYAELERGEHQEFKEEEAPYNAYYDWWQSNHRSLYELSVYDVTTGESRVWHAGEMAIYQDEDGDGSMTVEPYTLKGVMADGRFLYIETICESYGDSWPDVHVYAWNPATDETENLLMIENGGVKALNTYHRTNMVFLNQDGRFYYYIHGENGENDVYAYDLKTGESNLLHREPDGTSMLFRGGGNGWLVGDLYLEGKEKGICYMSEEDYEAGNFDAAKKIPF